MYYSSKEQEVLLAKYIADGNSKPIGDGAVFDSNCITPGTDFMVKLNHAFKDWVKRSMKTDPFWKKHTAHVIFSGSDVPGEGEHKIMEYIRKARVEEAWSPDLRHVMYGLDADLIMVNTSPLVLPFFPSLTFHLVLLAYISDTWEELYVTKREVASATQP